MLFPSIFHKKVDNDGSIAGSIPIFLLNEDIHLMALLQLKFKFVAALVLAFMQQVQSLPIFHYAMILLQIQH